ncbi:hypothetical protein HHK36_005636 [Tetracentron sinense]|uniref:Uncharacterized protein n=1 Tax=Tetracentron sinense TaxID=13715 RepID=A0A835DMG9_TETSI|nr:hypothetical protein HHK36_005636 [Tetracentron sinense]
MQGCEKERKARGLLEEVCNEFAMEIGEDKINKVIADPETSLRSRRATPYMMEMREVELVRQTASSVEGSKKVKTTEEDMDESSRIFVCVKFRDQLWRLVGSFEASGKKQVRFWARTRPTQIPSCTTSMDICRDCNA